MIKINDSLEIPAGDITFEFTTSSGPGGQNVNKVSTRAVLCFDLDESSTLSDQQKELIRVKLPGRVTKKGILRVSSQKFRTREANRKAAIERFSQLLRDALIPVRRRKKTRVPAGVKRVRLKDKKHRSRLKTGRKSPEAEGD